MILCKSMVFLQSDSLAKFFSFTSTVTNISMQTIGSIVSTLNCQVNGGPNKNGGRRKFRNLIKGW